MRARFILTVGIAVVWAFAAYSADLTLMPKPKPSLGIENWEIHLVKDGKSAGIWMFKSATFTEISKIVLDCELVTREICIALKASKK